MKSSHLFLTTLVLALLFGFTVSTSAREKLVFTPDSPDDTRKLIHAVNPAAGTVEIETMADGVMHPYKVDLGTVVKVNGSAANITFVRVGMEVFDYSERDPQTLDSLSVGPASAAPPPQTPPPKNHKAPPPDSQ